MDLDCGKYVFFIHLGDVMEYAVLSHAAKGIVISFDGNCDASVRNDLFSVKIVALLFWVIPWTHIRISGIYGVTTIFDLMFPMEVGIDMWPVLVIGVGWFMEVVDVRLCSHFS